MFFSVNFSKVLRTSFDWIPPDDFLLCLSENFENLSEHLFFRASLGNCLFHVQFAEFQPPDTVKNYITSAFQPFYTRTASSHSKTLKS